MTDVIDSIRGLRDLELVGEEGPFTVVRRDEFEFTMSMLTAGIGRAERLTDLNPDQVDRLRQAVIRLSNAERKASRE